MKIAVLGNCQASMIQLCVGFMSGVHADYFSRQAIDRSFEHTNAAGLEAELAPYDIVLSQSFGRRALDKVSNKMIRAFSRRYVGIPDILFTAFHPDCIYATTAAGEEAQSPIGAYHSALTLYGYRAGLTVAQTLSLFRADVLRNIGFLDHWAASQKMFEDGCRNVGFPGKALFAGWTRRGVFLHTINHPKLFVHEDIARLALQLAGVPVENEPCADYLHDGMLSAVWPVYPDVAMSLSLPGGYVFKRTTAPKPPADRFRPYMDLPEFVAGSYALYENYGDNQPIAPRVDAWLADNAVKAILKPI